MNKIVLMGRLVRDVEVRHTNSGMAIANYTLAVARRKKGEADFISCVAFDKAATFASTYFAKGQLVAVTGRLQVSSYVKDDAKVWKTDVIVEEQFFAESKRDSANTSQSATVSQDGLYPIDETIDDDDLPF